MFYKLLTIKEVGFGEDNKIDKLKTERLVDFMKLHLFWLDKNWEERGYANNYNLIIDMEKKIYKVYINSFYAYDRAEDIEVVRKSDITDYIEYLKENGFTEVESI